MKLRVKSKPQNLKNTQINSLLNQKSTNLNIKNDRTCAMYLKGRLEKCTVPPLKAERSENKQTEK